MNVVISCPYGIIYSAPGRIKIKAAVTDADSIVKKVQFFSGTTLLHTEVISPYGYFWIDVPVGNYTLTAKATDSSGKITTSNTIQVSVVDYNVPPVVSIVTPVNNATFNISDTIRLIATARDPNDRISKVEFYNDTTLLRTEFYYPYTYTWRNVPVGTYALTAVATDDKGNSDTSDPITILVVVPNEIVVSNKSSSVKLNSSNDLISLKISPNPAHNALQIYTNGLQQNIRSTISVISASGVVFKTIQVNTLSKIVQLDVSSLNAGVYFIKVINGDKVLYKQFVKL